MITQLPKITLALCLSFIGVQAIAPADALPLLLLLFMNELGVIFTVIGATLAYKQIQQNVAKNINVLVILLLAVCAVTLANTGYTLWLNINQAAVSTAAP